MSVLETKPSVERTTELQSKLYQAAKRDPSRRFHGLYDKLYLTYILQAAWERVRRNDGAPGIDQQSLAEIEAGGVGEFLAEIAQALREKTYRPQPVRRVYIPKEPGRTRPLGIPTVRDRVVQAAAKLVLEPIFEADFAGTPSFGFRPGLGQHDALAVVDQNSRAGYRWVVDADVERFFDTLDHQQLMTALRRRISDGEMLRLIYRWLKAGHLDEGSWHDTDEGSPQGSVISPLLGNVYLHAFDRAQQGEKSFVGRLVRFADDFVIQCGTRQHAERALAWAREQLARLGLRLNPEKTRIVEDREGFDFLGFQHRRVDCLQKAGRASRGTLRWPGRKTQRKFRDHIRELVGPPLRLRAHWSERLGALRRYLVGYCHYYRHGQSTRTFRKLDYYVECRISRNYARSQPTGKKRKPRNWLHYLKKLRAWGKLPKLVELQKGPFRAYQSEVKVGWRAG